MITPLQTLVLLVTPRFTSVSMPAEVLRGRMPDEMLIAGLFSQELIEEALQALSEEGLVVKGWKRTRKGDDLARKLSEPRVVSGSLIGDEYNAAVAFLKVCGVEFTDDQLDRYVLQLGFAALTQMLPVLARKRAKGPGVTLADLVRDFVQL